MESGELVQALKHIDEALEKRQPSAVVALVKSEFKISELGVDQNGPEVITSVVSAVLDQDLMAGIDLACYIYSKAGDVVRPNENAELRSDLTDIITSAIRKIEDANLRRIKSATIYEDKDCDAPFHDTNPLKDEILIVFAESLLETVGSPSFKAKSAAWVYHKLDDNKDVKDKMFTLVEKEFSKISDVDEKKYLGLHLIDEKPMDDPLIQRLQEILDNIEGSDSSLGEYKENKAEMTAIEFIAKYNPNVQPA